MNQTTGNANDIAQLTGKTITYFIVNEFGFPRAQVGRLVKAEVKPYAQYPQAICLQYIPKGKRKARGFWVLPNTDFAIWEGEHQVYANPVAETSTSAQGLICERWHTSFSSVFITNALKTPNCVYSQSNVK